MCGRFALFSSTEQIAEQFEANPAGLADMPPSVPRYNIAPTQPVLGVRLDEQGNRELTFFHWGLIPSWAKDMKFGSRLINARSETVDEKPSFRNAFKRRRCIIPADGFYEWQKLDEGKQPMFIQAADKRPLPFAGLWEFWRSPDGDAIQSCTILTTTPNEMMAKIHNRMPVILESEDIEMWLDPGDNPTDAMHLFRPYPAHKMTAYPVSKVVNNPRNDSPVCVEPV